MTQMKFLWNDEFYLFQFNSIDGDAVGFILQLIRHSQFVSYKDKFTVVFLEYHVVSLGDHHFSMTFIQGICCSNGISLAKNAVCK